MTSNSNSIISSLLPETLVSDVPCNYQLSILSTFWCMSDSLANYPSYWSLEKTVCLFPAVESSYFSFDILIRIQRKMFSGLITSNSTKTRTEMKSYGQWRWYGQTEWKHWFFQWLGHHWVALSLPGGLEKT